MLNFIAADSPEARRAGGFGAAPAVADGAVLASPKPAAVVDGAQAVADNTAARVSTLAKLEFALEEPAAVAQENRDSDLSLFSKVTAHRRASHRTDAVLTTVQHGSSPAPIAATPAAASLPPLNTTRLPYRGVLLDFTVDEPPPDFAERLAPSMERWQAEGVKSAMLKLPIEHAALATAAAEQGFSFHHVPLDADGRCVVLKRWLQPLLEDKIPPFATHQVGIAGLCIDDAGRLLVVKEWSDVEGGGREPSKQWKLPVS